MMEILSRPAKVMLVEDERIVALGIKSVIEEFGYQVCCTPTSGEEVLEILKFRRPDLILMDIRLDGRLDGIETAAIVNEEYNIPIIFMTAFNDRETMDRAKKTGPVSYLTKPVEASALKKQIAQALNIASHETSCAR